jgi:hypothetical protein
MPRRCQRQCTCFVFLVPFTPDSLSLYLVFGRCGIAFVLVLTSVREAQAVKMMHQLQNYCCIEKFNDSHFSIRLHFEVSRTTLDNTGRWSDLLPSAPGVKTSPDVGAIQILRSTAHKRISALEWKEQRWLGVPTGLCRTRSGSLSCVLLIRFPHAPTPNPFLEQDLAAMDWTLLVAVGGAR